MLRPNILFCTSPVDPCSCSGGGYEIYEKLCFAKKTNDEREAKTNLNSTEMATTSNDTDFNQAQAEFAGVFDALGDNTTAILVSLGVILGTGAVFTVAHLFNLLEVAKTEAREAEQREVELLKRVRDPKLLDQRDSITHIRLCPWNRSAQLTQV